jgi:hypothetical protein
MQRTPNAVGRQSTGPGRATAKRVTRVGARLSAYPIVSEAMHVTDGWHRKKGGMHEHIVGKRSVP